MTDKVQKIKDWISKEQDGLMDAQGNFEYPEHEGAYHILCNLDAYIDSLQEEPVSNVWHDAQIDSPQAKKKILAINEYGSCEVDYAINMALYWPKVIKWAYIDDLLKLDNSCQSCENLQEESVSEDLEEVALEWANKQLRGAGVTDENCPRELAVAQASLMVSGFKAGAKWQKQQDSIPSKDLAELIDTLSKRYPEVSFAKLSRIAVRVAKWKEKEMQSTIELVEDHAILTGMNKMEQQMMAKAIDAQCFGFQGAALFSFRLPADKYLVGSEVKVIVIEED